MAVEETALNATDAQGSGAHDDVLSSHFSGLEIADNGHVGAIKELAVCYELGRPHAICLTAALVDSCSFVWEKNGCADASRGSMDGMNDVPMPHVQYCLQLENVPMPQG